MSSWNLDSVPIEKVWRIYTNVNSGQPVTTANLGTTCDAFLTAWKLSFPQLDSYTYTLLAARKGSYEAFIYFECKEGIYISNGSGNIVSGARWPFLLKCTHGMTNLASASAVAVSSDDNYGVYNGITATGSPIPADQTYASIELMKTALESLGFTTYLKKNTGVANVPSGIVVNTNITQKLKYTSIESASQLVNAVLNRQGLHEVLAIDKTGLARQYYDTIYMLSYIVQQRNFPKFVT